MTRRLGFEEVKSEFKKQGYLLLEKDYKNNTTKMKYRCPRHPDKELSITIKDLRYGHGCPFCAGLGKPTYEEVSKEFEKRGYELIEKEYLNALTKMSYKCPVHPDKELSITLNKLKLGQGCPHCGYMKRVSNRRGENHHNWKGGTTSIKDFLRNSEVLKKWKFKSLEKYSFTCFVTNEYSKELEVHHPLSFSVIRDRAIEYSGLEPKQSMGEYTPIELERLMKEFESIHDKHEGIPLKKEIHKLFHMEYGNAVSIKYLYEFKERYQTGEYDYIKPLSSQFA